MATKSTRRRTSSILTAAGVGIAGVVGGGILAASVTATAADTDAAESESRSLVDRLPGFDAGHEGRGDRTPVDPETAAQVEQAVLAAYEGASIHHIEAEDDGYEAYILTAEGEKLEVELDSGFAITGEEPAEDRGPRGPRGPGGGPEGGHGEPVDPEVAAQIEEAVLGAYEGARIHHVEAEEDGYEAYILTAEGEKLEIELDGSFAIVGEEEIEEGERPRGPGRPSRGAPVDAAIAEQVEQAVLAAYPDALVGGVHEEGDDADGQPVYAAHVRTADGEHLEVTLDDGFAITGEEERPEPGEDGFRGPHGPRPEASGSDASGSDA